MLVEVLRRWVYRSIGLSSAGFEAVGIGSNYMFIDFNGVLLFS